MPQQQIDFSGKTESRSIIDYFFYLLAGGAFTAISYSFLIWLQF